MGIDGNNDTAHAYYGPPSGNDPGTWTHYEYQGRIYIAEPDSGGGVTFFNQILQRNELIAYRMGRPAGPNETFQLLEDRSNDISYTPRASQLDSGLVPTAQTWYWFRIVVRSFLPEESGRNRPHTAIQAKVWEDGTPEPLAFQMTAEDNAGILESGTVGVYAETADAVYFNNLQVTRITTLANQATTEDVIRLFDGDLTTELNQLPSNWRNLADSTNDSFKTILVQTQALTTLDTAENLYSHYQPDGPDGVDVLPWQNYTYSGKVYVGEAASNVGVTVYSRFPEQQDHFYRLSRSQQRPELHLDAHPADILTLNQSGSSNDVPVVTNAWYWFRIAVQSTTASGEAQTRIRAKVWMDGSLEPEEFQLDTTDNSRLRSSAGTVGVWAGGPGLKAFDNLRVTTGATDLFFDNFESYGLNQHPTDWRDTTVRSLFETDPTLLRTSDIGFNLPRWQSIPDVPLLRHPLNRRALGFDGARQYLAASAGGTLGALTLEAWVTVSQQQVAPILAGRDRISNHTFWVGLNNSGQVIINLQTDQTQTVAGNQSLAVAELTHVALTIDDTTVTIYVDAVVDAQVELSVPFVLTVSDIEVGRDFGSQYFAGTLRDLRLWNTVRGPETFAVSQRYQQLPLEDPAGQSLVGSLVGYWPFPETEGNLTVDVSGNGNDLRLGGLVGDRHPVPTFAPNLPDFWQNRQTFCLTAANQHLSFSRSEDDLGVLQRRTIEVWFKVDDPYITRRKQVLYAQGDDQRGLVIYIHDGYLFFGGYNRPQDESCWEGTWLCSDRIKPGQWHHAALVLDGRADVRPYGLQGYLDGKLADTGTGAQLDRHQAAFTLGGLNTTIPFHDGSSSAEQPHWFAGEILELRIWDTVLAPEIIRDNHNQSLASNAPPLALWWTFDDITASQRIVADRSTNDQSFTLANDAVVKALVSQPGYQLPTLLLNAVTLKDLATLRQLQSRYQLSMDRLTALWFEVEHTGTADGITLFDRLFNPTDLTRDPWPYYIHPPLRWDVSGRELPSRDRALHSRLMAALQVSSGDLDQAVAYLSTATETPVELTTSYLNQLYRLTQLPKTLRLSLPEFFRLLQLLGIADIESIQTVGDVKRISDRVQEMQAIGITVAELDFFANDIESPAITVTPEDTALRTLADDLANQAVDLLIQPTALVTDDINDAQALALLAYLRRNNLIQDLGLTVAEFDNFTVVSPNYTGVTDIPLTALGAATVLDWRQAFVAFEAQLRREVRSSGGGNGQPINIAEARRETGAANLPQFEVLQPLIDNGVITAEGVVLQTQVPNGILAADLSTLAQRVTDFLAQQHALQQRIQTALDETLTRSRTEHANAILANLAELFNANPDTMQVLIDYLASTLVPLITPVVLTQWLLTISSNPETTPIPAAASGYFYRLGKLNALVNEFSFTVSETRALLANPGDFGVSNVFNPTLDDLARLYTFTQLKQDFDDPNGTLSDQLVAFLQLDNPTTEAPASPLANSLYKAILDIAVIWDPLQLQGTIAYFGNDLLLKPDSGVSHRVEGLRQLQQAFAQAEILRTQVTTLIALANTRTLTLEFYQTQAATLLNLLRALYSDEEWPQVYRPIRDPLAILKRDALLGIAMQDIDFPSQFEGRRSADLLYEYLLLDVQVSSEVETSRIVQAIASVQLYVQRCLLSLESGVNALGIPTQQWDWMRNYRVWEANRKVFLYPESYIEPELRDTKTPFFEELEQELMQSNIDQDAVEQAYSNYLNKFIEVANLKIVGSYLHREPGDPLSEGTLYLIGRTETEPITYYYRTRQGSDRWLPWEKIDLGINGTIATPVFAFGRLFLFWIEFSESSESIPSASASNSSENDSVTVFEPTLRFSHLNVNGGWLQPQTYQLVQTVADLPTVRDAIANVTTAYNASQTQISTLSNTQISASNLLNVLNQSRNVADQIDALSGVLVLISPRSRQEQTTLNQVADNLKQIAKNIRTSIDNVSTEYSAITTIFLFRPFFNSIFSNSILNAVITAWIAAIDQAQDAVSNALVTLSSIQVDALRLTPEEQQQFGWQRVYAQQVVEFAPTSPANEREDNARVLAVSKATVLQQSLPTISMNALTIEFWVNLANPNPNGTRTNATSTIEVLNYESNRLVVGVTTVQTSIPGVENAINGAIAAANQTRTLLDNTADATNLPTAAAVQTEVRAVIRQAQQAVTLATTLQTEDVSGQESRSANLLNRAQSLLQELQNLDNDNADTVLTRIQETSRRDALLLASNRLHSNSRNDDATDTQLRFQTLTANVEVSGVSGLSIVGSIDLNYNQWHHVAITLSAVSANAYTVEVYRDGVSQRQGQLANGLTANGSLTIAQQLDSDAQTRLTAQLSDVRLWSVIRAANDIQTQRSTRQSEQAAGLALYYPLNRRIEGATLDIVRSTLDFTVVPEFTALNSRNQRERIILFYGNQDEIIRTRRNNQDDQGFSLTLSAQNQQQFDLTLAPTFELYIGQNQSLITDNFVDAGVTAQNALLQSLTPNEVSVRDVHNQPGWYVVDTGDEQFLVEGNPQQGQLDSAGDRINLTYGNITGSGRQPVSIQFSQEEALATTGGLPTFEFVRLSTFAAYDLSVNLFRNGLDGLLTLEAQRTPEILFSTYQPNSQRVIPPPQYISGLDTIDFNGVNGGYYWEVFFHIPFFIANQLNANQSFADAQRWYHYIFDPTQQGVGSDRYWRFLPFRAQQLDTLAQLLLVTDPSDPGLARFREALEIYRQDPFDPHAIARLRINAYQKAIVMKYIDNLLDWGDSLFIQDTRESVNEAAQLYVLAFNLLGPRPEARASRPFEDIGDYNGIETSLTDIPDFITDLNRPLPPLPIPQNGLVLTTFCVPENPDFLAYWDRVEDRLFKIRHSLNIEGIFRQQALFQPPLDVRALVQAAAAGNRDIGSLLADVNRAVPHYRYAFMLDQAKGMIDVVKELGGALLEALETRDDKALSGLEHTHAQTVRKMMTSIREGAIAEAKANIEALTISKQRSENRKQHFDDLISTGLSGEEIAQLVLSSVSQVLKTAAGLLKSTSSALEIAPDLIVGGAGISSPVTLTLAGGGSKLAESVSDWADGFEIVGDLTALAGEVTGKVGEYKRRAQDWRLEQQTANFDVQEIEVQIAIAQSELATAEQELLIHQTEIAQSDEVAAFNRSKFTNSQLYSWLSSRLAGLYFQSYRLAYDFAKAAERALQYELPTNERFINFGHWDSLRRGLLAGESLLLDINRMEKFHLDNDSRFQEIEKTISMKRTFPVEFITLVTTGVCDFQLTERLFNQDYPGHYFRVIKSMALTVNANNVQPYQTINATLTQLGNKALLDPDIGAVRYLMGDESAATPDASVLRVDWRSNQQIAVSTTAQDNGMFGSFDLNFVFDDRYFPFEGTGAVSTWNLEIPLSTNPDLVENDQGVSFLDIDDIIIHLQYTSKYDRGAFKQAVEAEVNKPII
ncbi:MAG: neuraminidase-like domain-containing protein [Cyanobacteria bacterium P01_F01_bin.116]